MPGKGPSKPESSSTAKRDWLSAPGALGLVNPKLSVLVALIVMLACAAVAWGLPISTSRYKLMADDNPEQAKLLSFFDRFGYPDSLVLVVTGCHISL